ncbi:hypothetical protein [uncultured Mediterranean phage uvMED]|jgi:hypothetical protein|nr:hypothetical protein [uncultured Mediterranean phage uvMED]
MAITKKTEIGQIEIVGEFKAVQVRTDTIILEDGIELSRQYHRHFLLPDADISSENEQVQGVCNAVWTQEVKDAYAAHRAAELAKLEQEEAQENG